MVESALSGERAALPPPGPPSRQIGRPSDQNRAAPWDQVAAATSYLKSGGPGSGGWAGPPGRPEGGHPQIEGGPNVAAAGPMGRPWWPGGRPRCVAASRQRASEGGRRRIGRIGRIERFDALNALRTIAFEGSSLPRVSGEERGRRRHTAAQSADTYCILTLGHTHTHTHTNPRSLARLTQQAAAREGDLEMGSEACAGVRRKHSVRTY